MENDITVDSSGQELEDLSASERIEVIKALAMQCSKEELLLLLGWLQNLILGCSSKADDCREDSFRDSSEKISKNVTEVSSEEVVDRKEEAEDDCADEDSDQVWVYFKADATTSQAVSGMRRKKKPDGEDGEEWIGEEWDGDKAEFTCKYCSAAFSHRLDYRRHRQEAHSNRLKGKKRRADREFQCEECGKSFARRAVYEIHLQRHGDPVNCETCGKVCPNQPALYAHAQRYHEDKRYDCDKCDKTFRYLPELSSHMLGHEGKFFVCSICQSSFRLKSGLHSHMRNVHIHPPSSCEVCGKVYKRKDKLKKHMVVHTRKKEEEEPVEEEKTKSTEKKNVFCQYCGKVYANVGGLKYHMVVHETKEKKFVCPKCGMAFLRERNLTIHLNTKHMEADLFCTQCPRSFKNARNLIYHMRIVHEAEKLPFKCEFCGRGYITQSKLASHRTNVHIKNRPWSCRFQCGKSYNDRSNRNSHERKAHGRLFAAPGEGEGSDDEMIPAF